MMTLNTVKNVIVGVLLAGVLGIISLGYYHYQGVLSELDALTAANAKMEKQLEDQEATAGLLRDALAEWQSAQAELLTNVEERARAQTEAANEVRRLVQMFSEHDLSLLSQEHPGMVESRVNDGYAASGRVLECVTAGGQDCTD